MAIIKLWEGIQSMGYVSPVEELQQKWTQIVKPKLDASNPKKEFNISSFFSILEDFFSQTHPKQPSEQTNFREIYENYHFGNVVTKLKQLQADGMLIYGFFGKTPFEALPKAEKNEVWVSIDHSVIPYYTADKETTSTILDPNRLFLLLDCNQQEGLELVQGLFDKVVIDKSTPKFFENDFVRRFTILLHDSQSKMIFPQPVRIATDIVAREEKFNTLSYHFTYKILDENDNEIWSRAIGHAKNHFMTIFNKVEVCRGPFPTLLFDFNQHFFIVEDRKDHVMT
jgi:hypothetical protein